MNKSGIFEFDPLDRIYLSHLPGRPVVPGALVIRAFIGQLPPGDFSIDVFGFERFAPPGRYEFRINEEDGRFLCWLGKGERTYARGRLSLCA